MEWTTPETVGPDLSNAEMTEESMPEPVEESVPVDSVVVVVVVDDGAGDCSVAGGGNNADAVDILPQSKPESVVVVG